jgi:hypothetical protein
MRAKNISGTGQSSMMHNLHHNKKNSLDHMDKLSTCVCKHLQAPNKLVGDNTTMEWCLLTVAS